MLCKTYCFAFQKRRFCAVKAAVLHRKTYAFATSKRSYHFLTELSLQSQGKILPSVFLYYGRSAGIFAVVSGKPKENY